MKTREIWVPGLTHNPKDPNEAGPYGTNGETGEPTQADKDAAEQALIDRLTPDPKK